MSRTKTYSLLIAGALLVLGMGSISPTLAMQDEDDQKVRVEREIKVDGDSGDAGHHAVFITEDGKVTEISGEGNDFTWVSGDDDGEHRVMFFGEGDEAHEVDGEEGLFSWAGEDGKPFSEGASCLTNSVIS